MSDQDAFNRILASLCDAMLDDTQWPATSALIDEACGIVGNVLLISGGPPDDVRVLFAQAHYRGQRREDWEREYLEHYHPIDERIPRFRQLPDSRLVHIRALYTTEELQTSPAYNEAMARMQAQDSVNVRLVEPDGSHITWSPQNPVAPGGWSTPQLALIRGLLPHLRQYVRVRQALAKAEALSTSVIDLLATPRLGVIHLDRRGQIVEANDRARAMLRQGDGVVDQDGVLSARVPADQARFAQLVAAALVDPGAVSGSMLLQRGAVMPRLVVHVNPVGVRQPDLGAQRVAALVLLVEPGRQARLDPALVAATLGLTPLEGQVAVWLAEGWTVREIAAARGRQVGSVHWHLKQIYQKLGISRQADLVRLVLSVAAFG